MNTPSESIDAFLDGELTLAQEAELYDWLAADREHLREFVRATHLHGSLRTELLTRRILPLPLQKTDLGRLMRWRSTIFALAAGIALFIGLSVWLFPPATNEPTLSVAAGNRVILERNGQSLPAQDGLKLLPGDLLRSSGSNGAAIAFGKENTRLELEDDTELKTLAWQRGKRFELRQGKLEATVARQQPWRPMLLTTAQAEARVLGTKFTLAASTNATRLDVTEGTVKLTRSSDKTSVKVRAGQYAIAATGYELAAQPRTGSILAEYWTNMVGATWVDLFVHPNYPDRPDRWNYLTNLSSLEMPSDWADNYGLRLRGYIHPPETGTYTFWIAAKDDASLWLTPGEEPKDKIQMAHSIGAASRDWDNNPAQHSSALPLTAGKRYYFEVLYKAGVGDDHLAVAWQGPGREREVIPSEYLSPFKHTETMR